VGYEGRQKIGPYPWICSEFSGTYRSLDSRTLPVKSRLLTMITGCARRACKEFGFGREFDSRRLHQRNTSRHLIIGPVRDDYGSWLFAPTLL